MEAKELMVGDWVNIAIEEYNNPTRIKEIGPFWVKVIKDEMEYGNILVTPIPLTKEILEKNGFKCDAHPNYICDNYFVDGISLLDFRGGYFKYNSITLEYVHQLQHLLKLRNIDKEIEL